MKDPYSVCKKVEQFLGLEPYFKKEHFVYSSKKGFFCKRLRGRTICMDSKKGRKHKNATLTDIAKLQDYFRPHNRILENMLNMSFNWP